MPLLPTTLPGRVRLLALLVLPLVAAGCVVARATRMPGVSFAGEPGPLPAPLADLPARLERHPARARATDIGQRGAHAPDGLARA